MVDVRVSDFAMSLSAEQRDALMAVARTGSGRTHNLRGAVMSLMQLRLVRFGPEKPELMDRLGYRLDITKPGKSVAHYFKLLEELAA